MNTKIKFLTLAVLFIAIFTSCNNNNEPGEPLYYAFATVENPDSTRNYLLIDDDDESRLKPVNASKILKNGQRVYIWFYIQEEKSKEDDYQYSIEYRSLYEILTKGIINFTDNTSQETRDSIGNDPILINNIWAKRNFLNFEFIFGADNPSIQHYINLVSDDTKTYDDQKIHLEFKHNSKGDLPYNQSGGLASFDLLPLRTQAVGDSINIVVHWRSYGSESEKKHEITYKFNSTETDPEPKIEIKESGFVIK